MQLVTLSYSKLPRERSYRGMEHPQDGVKLGLYVQIAFFDGSLEFRLERTQLFQNGKDDKHRSEIVATYAFFST